MTFTDRKSRERRSFTSGSHDEFPFEMDFGGEGAGLFLIFSSPESAKFDILIISCQGKTMCIVYENNTLIILKAIKPCPGNFLNKVNRPVPNRQLTDGNICEKESSSRFIIAVSVNIYW